MTKLFAFAFAALLAFGLSSTDAAAGGYGYGCGPYERGCARAVEYRGCGHAYRRCKPRLKAFFRKAPRCGAYAPCAAPVYVQRPEPVIIDVRPVRPAYYGRPCQVYRGCGHW